MTTMSKLKRKKSAVEECRSEQQFRIKKTNENVCTVQESNCSKTSTGSSAADAVSWWERSELSDVERIWALTWRALCPTLQPNKEEYVPKLPPPSSTFPQRGPVEKVSDWRWHSPDEDVNAPPDLPAPSFLNHLPPVNDFNPHSHTPVAQNTRESGQLPLINQESHKSHISQQRHLEEKVNCGHASSDKPSNKLGPVGKESECCEMEHHGKTSIKSCSSLVRAPSNEMVEGVKLNTKAPSGDRNRQDSSGMTGGQGREWEKQCQKSMSEKQVGAGGSLGRLEVESGARGSGLGKKSGVGGSGSGLQTKSVRGGSGLSWGTRGSVLGLGAKSGAGGSGSGLVIKSVAGGSGLGAKSGAGGSGSGLQTNSGPGRSGLSWGTQSEAGGSGSGLGAKSGAGGFKSELGVKSEAGGSEEGSGSGLECCPMCLMPFHAGFSQMECDAHLAQCLSEMNEDIAW
ncbi:keratin, type I cytoskeletal 9 [Xyrauchen texanus]|uniref:keratin, type I cytoskeletal 9 n=1 Tax=Xyrauchen texanus TaxID=154827 RepID=UPI0022419349|nr:keratin, type I cytoskeletal 9 [Xyrauchen texanus]